MARKVQVTFDAAEPHSLLRWWAELLGYQVDDPHEFVTDLLAKGVLTEGDTVSIDGRLAFADAASAVDPSGSGPRFYAQRVPESKQAKNRLHLDVPIGEADLDDEVARVTAMGATLVGFDSYPGHRWAVMHDPEGNEFCLQ
jgi:hypothetical protein